MTFYLVFERSFCQNPVHPVHAIPHDLNDHLSPVAPNLNEDVGKAKTLIILFCVTEVSVHINKKSLRNMFYLK